MNNTDMIFVSIIVLIVWIVVAFLFGEVALQKGHSLRKYTIICFLLGFIGWLLVIALPDRKGNKQ